MTLVEMRQLSKTGAVRPDREDLRPMTERSVEEYPAVGPGKRRVGDPPDSNESHDGHAGNGQDEQAAHGDPPPAIRELSAPYAARRSRSKRIPVARLGVAASCRPPAVRRGPRSHGDGSALNEAAEWLDRRHPRHAREIRSRIPSPMT